MKRFFLLITIYCALIAQINAQTHTLSGNNVVPGTATLTLQSGSVTDFNAGSSVDFTGATVTGLPAASAAWGAVSGTLSDQTDLQSALDAKVNTTRTVNGHALSSNVTVTSGDVGLGNVTNDAQTKAAIVSNTAPTSGQILIGNAGNTAYAKQTLIGSGATIGLSSGGVLSISGISNSTLSNSAITIAGTSTSLGGSITVDTILGLSGNGFVKRTGANTYTSDNSTYVTGAGGSNTQVQINNGGAFGGITNATSDGTTLTVTSPKIVTNVLDTNGNAILSLAPVGSAVNYLEISNSTAGAHEITAYPAGATANVDFKMMPKGTGVVRLHNNITDFAVNSASITVDVGGGMTIGQGSTDTPLRLSGQGLTGGNDATFSLVNIPDSTLRTVNIAGGANSTTVVPDTGASNNFLTAISANGAISKARPTISNLTNLSGTSKLVGSNASSAAVTEITLGTNLSMSGSTLNATGGGGGTPGGSDTQVQFNNSGAFGGNPSATFDTDGNLTLTGIGAVGTYGQLIIKGQGGAGDSAVFLRGGHGTPNDWFFGAGSGAPNNFFRIVDLTTGVTDVFNIQTGSLHQIGLYGLIGWGASGAGGALDTALTRNAAGVVEINNGTAGQWGALKSGVRDGGTTTVTDGVIIGHQSTGTPAAGFGSGILFNANDSTTADVNVGRQKLEWTTATHNSNVSKYTLQLTNGSTTLADAFSVTGAGTASIPGNLELGNASDTTLARSSAGHISVEGSVVGLASDTLSFFTTSTSNTIGVGNIELGAASDTTISRASAGKISVEGVTLLDTTSISDTAFASSWDGVTTVAPSKNAVYDQFVASGAWDGTAKVSGSDYTNATTSLTDVTGLTTGTLTASTLYEFECQMQVNSSSTAGMQVAITNTGSGTGAIYTWSGTATSAAATGMAIGSNASGTAGAACVLVNGDGEITMKGHFKTSSAGTPGMKIQALKTTSGTATVRIGSILKWKKA